MKFEVVKNGKTTMSTLYISCIPDEKQLASLSKFGHKFKIDGKTVNLKGIKEFIAQNRGEQE